MKKFKDNQKGFTLIELIVVIAILGILALMMVPKLGGFQENAKQATDEQAAAVVESAAKMYFAKDPTATAVTLTDLKTADLIESDIIKPASKKYNGKTIKIDVTTGEVKAEWN